MGPDGQPSPPLTPPYEVPAPESGASGGQIDATRHSRRAALVLAGTAVGVVLLVVALVIDAALLSARRPTRDPFRRPAAPASSTLVPEPPPIPEETLYSVPGITFAPAPFDTRDIVAVAEAQLHGSARAVSARVVLRDRAREAVVVVFQFGAQVTSAPGYPGDVLDGVSQGAAGSERTTIEGSPALYYVNHDLGSLVVVKGSLAVFVVGSPRTERSRLAEIAAGITRNVP